MRVEERIAPYALQATLLVPLGEVCKTTSGGTPSRKNPDYFSGPIPWVKSGELPDGPVVEIEESISEEALHQSSAKLFPAGTLLMALYGATVGKLGILTRPAATNQAVCAIFPPPDLDTKFLFWFLRFKRSELIAQAVGGAQPNISQGIVRDLKIPLLPLNQQKRIVAEIEKQFSRLDEAIANLKRVKANLKRYKAAVLKAAVEGRLVETEADLAHREGRSYETGAQLLQSILEARRSQWQGKGKYKEPAAPDTTDLPKLPEGWVWATVDQLGATGQQAVLTGPFGSNMGKADFQDTGVPVFTIGCLREEDLDISKAVFVSEEKSEELARYKLAQGDMLFSRMASVGRAGFVTQQFEGALFNYHIMRLRLDRSVIDSMLFIYYVRGSKAVQDYVREVNHGATRDGINTEQLLNMPVAVSPVAEQHRIVAELDRRLSLLRETEAQVDANLLRAERLRQSILSRAFSQAPVAHGESYAA